MYFSLAFLWFPGLRHLGQRIACLYSLVPFCQIAVMLSSLNLHWPAWLDGTFFVFSSFNLNIRLSLHR